MSSQRIDAHVAAFVGSPRRHGNTERLVDEALRGCQEMGADTRKILLCEHEIGLCQGCLTCYPGGLPRCARIEDEMPQIVEVMQWASVWLLATPVYCYGPTALFKRFLDRWIALLPEVYCDTAATSLIPLHMSRTGAQPTLDVLDTTIQSFGIQRLEPFVAPGLLEKDALDEEPELLAQSYLFGRHLVEDATRVLSSSTPRRQRP